MREAARLAEYLFTTKSIITLPKSPAIKISNILYGLLVFHTSILCGTLNLLGIPAKPQKLVVPTFRMTEIVGGVKIHYLVIRFHIFQIQRQFVSVLCGPYLDNEPKVCFRNMKYSTFGKTGKNVSRLGC